MSGEMIRKAGPLGAPADLSVVQSMKGDPSFASLQVVGKSLEGLDQVVGSTQSLKQGKRGKRGKDLGDHQLVNGFISREKENLASLEAEIQKKEALYPNDKNAQEEIKLLRQTAQFLRNIINGLQSSGGRLAGAIGTVEVVLIGLQQLQINGNLIRSKEQQEVSQKTTENLKYNLKKIQENLKKLKESQSGGLFGFIKHLFESIGKLFENIGKAIYYQANGETDKAKAALSQFTSGFKIFGEAFKKLFSGDFKEGFEELLTVGLITMVTGIFGLVLGPALLGSQVGKDIKAMVSLVTDAVQALGQLLGAGILAAVGDRAGAKKLLDSDKELGKDMLMNPALKTLSDIAMVAIMVAMAATGNVVMAGMMLALFVASEEGWLQKAAEKLGDAMGGSDNAVTKVIADVIVIAAVTALTAGAGAAQAAVMTSTDAAVAAVEEAAKEAVKEAGETAIKEVTQVAEQVVGEAAKEASEVVEQTAQEAVKEVSEAVNHVIEEIATKIGDFVAKEVSQEAGEAVKAIVKEVGEEAAQKLLQVAEKAGAEVITEVGEAAIKKGAQLAEKVVDKIAEKLGEIIGKEVSQEAGQAVEGIVKREGEAAINKFIEVGEEVGEEVIQEVGASTVQKGTRLAEEIGEEVSQGVVEKSSQSSSRSAQVAKSAASTGAIGLGSTLGSSTLASDMLKAMHKDNETLMIIFSIIQSVVAAALSAGGGFATLSSSFGNAARSAESVGVQFTQLASRVQLGASMISDVSGAMQGGAMIIQGENSKDLAWRKEEITVDGSIEGSAHTKIQETGEELKQVIKEMELPMRTVFKALGELANQEFQALIQG